MLRIVLGNLQMFGAVCSVVLLVKTGTSKVTVSVTVLTGVVVMLSVFLFQIRRYER